MNRTAAVVSLILSSLCLAAPLAQAQIGDEEPTYVSMTYSIPQETGLVRTPESENFLMTAPRQSFDEKGGAVPGSRSLRGQAGPVENQGSCGSCWSFALTTVLRGTLIQNSTDPGRLSFNYLLNCTPQPHGLGCNGGDFAAADLMVSPKGAPAYGADGNYTQKDGPCQHKPAKAGAASYRLLGTNLGNSPGKPKPSFRDIAYAIGVLRRPVAADVNADSHWMNYSSGVFNGCGGDNTDQINHMITIEGYDCESSVDSKGNCVFDANGNLPAGVGTWIIRNSWGTSWGQGGYMTMKATDKQGRRCNSIATDALYYTLN